MISADLSNWKVLLIRALTSEVTVVETEAPPKAKLADIEADIDLEVVVSFSSVLDSVTPT